MGLEEIACRRLSAGEVGGDIAGCGGVELEGNEAAVQLGCGQAMPAGLQEARNFEFGGAVSAVH